MTDELPYHRDWDYPFWCLTHRLVRNKYITNNEQKCLLNYLAAHNMRMVDLDPDSTKNFQEAVFDLVRSCIPSISAHACIHSSAVIVRAKTLKFYDKRGNEVKPGVLVQVIGVSTVSWGGNSVEPMIEGVGLTDRCLWANVRVGAVGVVLYTFTEAEMYTLESMHKAEKCDIILELVNIKDQYQNIAFLSSSDVLVLK